MEFVNDMRKKGQLIMGIGHRVKSVSTLRAGVGETHWQCSTVFPGRGILLARYTFLILE